MKILLKFTILLLISAAFYSNAAAQNLVADQKSQEQHAKWFKKGKWLGGLKVTPHASINQQEFAKQYRVNKEMWDKAFAYLRDTDLKATAPGKHLIDGENVFATVTEAPTRAMDRVMWESHRNYIDIHYLITGKEQIGIGLIQETNITKPFDAVRDLINYDSEKTNGTFYIADQGVFFICFPSDAHRPSINVEGYPNVKKVVIKIRVAN